MRCLDGITDSIHEFEQTPGDGEGQESLACCSPWGRKESGMTERLTNNTNKSCVRGLLAQMQSQAPNHTSPQKSTDVGWSCSVAPCSVTKLRLTLFQPHGL